MATMELSSLSVRVQLSTGVEQCYRAGFRWPLPMAARMPDAVVLATPAGRGQDVTQLADRGLEDHR